jgi:putative FmdB family regulatory protein
MPLHDFKCKKCSHIHEELVKWDIKTHTCPKCDNESKRVFLKVAKPNYLAMGAQKDAGPEFQTKFDKLHRDQAAKEKAFEKEHGEGQYYNTAPGG